MKLRYDRRYLMTFVLAMCAATLLATIGYQTGWGQRFSLPIPRTTPQQSKLVLASLQPEFGLLPLEQAYTEVLARPLFVPSRRPPPPPPPPPPVVPPKPVMKKGQFTLVGVILTKAKNVALLRENVSGKVSRVEQGKEINGIRVDSMKEERVVLKQWDDTEELVLKFQSMPKVVPITPGAPPGMPGAPGVPAPVSAPQGTPGDIINQRRALRGLPP